MKQKFLFGSFTLLFTSTVLTANSFAEEKVYGEKEYSTIEADGELVPVGEKNKYRLAYNTWNVWTNPFSWFVGTYSIGGSYAFHPNFKINVAPEFTRTFNRYNRVTGGGMTISGSVFFKKVYDGFYLEPGIRMAVLQEDIDTVGVQDDTDITAGPQLIAGWGWIWDSGFNVNIGLGLGYTWTQEDDGFEDYYYDGIFAAGNLQFGYTF